jgi:mRNA-degrading endonuclease RelE of RelBE toxin-antitoxin system
MLDIVLTEIFKRQFKQLAKKYPSLRKDFNALLDEIEKEPTFGTSIGDDCYKIRLAIGSKNKGKRGGSRVITHVLFTDNCVRILSIYDKGEKDTLEDKELKKLKNQKD